MARDLGRDPGTVSRKTSRNCGQRDYRHQQADGKATTRCQQASATPRKRTPEHWAVVEDRLREGRSWELAHAAMRGAYRRIIDTCKKRSNDSRWLKIDMSEEQSRSC